MSRDGLDIILLYKNMKASSMEMFCVMFCIYLRQLIIKWTDWEKVLQIVPMKVQYKSRFVVYFSSLFLKYLFYVFEYLII